MRANLNRFVILLDPKRKADPETFTDEYTADAWLDEWELQMQYKIEEFSRSAKYIKFIPFTISGFLAVFVDDILGDAFLMLTAIMLVGSYSFFFLGGCSPIHMRFTVAFMGLVCVGLSFTSGCCIAFYFEQKVSNIHAILPFLLIGIGVDDMFVVCNAID